MAFKEWAVVVDALGRGRQILILRKGGIHEGRDGYQTRHRGFLLFPTLFHQQGDSVIPEARQRFAEMAADLPGQDEVRLTHSCELVEEYRIESPRTLERLRGLHIWKDEVLATRLDWGGEKRLHALVVRVFQLASVRTLPMRKQYGGCRSWVELDEEIPIEGATPVLSDEAFVQECERVRNSLQEPIRS